MAYGYAIGNGFLNRYSPVDIATSNFVDAAGINDATIIKAVDMLVRGLKANDTWDKFHALYPFVGGTALSHSFNLVNPAQYQIVWSASGVTHDSTGITGDGVSGYGDTQYVTQPANQNNMHLSVYVRNNVLSRCAIGTCFNNSGLFSQIYPRFGSNFYDVALNQNSTLTTSSADCKGFLSTNRIISNELKSYKNQNLAATSAQISAGVALASVNLLARNSNSIRGDYSIYNLGLASIGQGFNDSEIGSVYTIVQEFQVFLNRQV